MRCADLQNRPVEEWIEALAAEEPPFTSLGTPFLADTEAVQALVQMGSAAVPALVRALEGANAKLAMYAAHCLGLIGDASALPALRRIEEQYSAREPKAEYDYGVMSAAAQARERLSKEQ